MSEANSLSSPYILSFQDDITLLKEPDGQICLKLPHTSLPLPQVSRGVLALLETLASAGGTESQLLDLVLKHDGDVELANALYHLHRLTQQGLICHTVMVDEGKLATIVPISSAYQFIPRVPREKTRYVLSRFAYLHQVDGLLVLESPLAHAKLVLYHWQATALIHALSTSCTLDDLSRQFTTLAKETISLFVSLLLAGQLLSEVQDEGQVAEDQQQTLAQWAFHDLLFHARSRAGRHTLPFGKTFPFLEEIAPLPAVKTGILGQTFPLYKPDLEMLMADDLPFSRVIEERQSIRQYGEQPITVEQLGEFLYRTARVKVRIPTSEMTRYEISYRPYPSGGACYELELYLAVNTCQGLASGFYYYQPQEHHLYKIADRSPQVGTLLQDAFYATGGQVMPQVLIILAARFQRVSWCYQGMAYAATLKNVGVLYQTMYLVATAMGLAPCALGAGNADLFAAVAGTDYCEETSVGEFMLGSRADKA